MALRKLIALGAINEDGKITEIGLAMSKFDGVKPEISRALISSYNYNCSTEISELAAIFEITKFRLDKIFKDFNFRGNKTEFEAEKRKFMKRRDKWICSGGEIMSLINVYKEYKKRAYDLTDRNGKVIKEKTGDVKKWCSENSFGEQALKKVKRISKDYHKKLFSIVKAEKNKFLKKYSNKNNIDKKEILKDFNLFSEDKVELFEDKDKNIISALLDGFFVNIIRNKERKIYNTCFPEKKLSVSLNPRESLLAKLKKVSKYCFYAEFGSIFGNKSLRIVTTISPAHITKIKKNEQKSKYIEDCLSDSKFKKLIEDKEKSKFKKKKFYKKKKY